MKNKDLEIIKKYYGEDMSKMCRKLFPTILEVEGKLSNILLARFYPTRHLYEDIINNNKEKQFKNYIYSLFNVNSNLVKTTKSVKELLSEAGYDLYECHTEEDIQNFSKYYAHGEELCTFEGGRLNSCYVFFAVKKGADKLNRYDFPYPDRQDEYGTSVISIQFSKGELNTLSIKNRYNHKVENPDATFGNNLDNIIPGLTDAFIREYHYNIIPDNQKTFELSHYTFVTGKNKYYRYNYAIHNIFYTNDNKIIDRNGKVTSLDHSRYLLMDYYLVDFQEKKITLIDSSIEDDFPNQFRNITKIESINIPEGKKLIISMKDYLNVEITLDKYNRITSLINPNLTIINNNFMRYNKVVNKIEIPKVRNIGDNFLLENEQLQEINLPNIKEIGDGFIRYNEILKTIYLPILISVKDDFLHSNRHLQELLAPSLQKTGKNFMFMNRIINNINLKRLRTTGDNFFFNNRNLEELDLPALEYAGHNFLCRNTNICSASLFNLLEVGNNFLEINEELRRIVVPKLKKVGNNFLFNNEKITEAKIGSLEEAGNNFMYYNLKLNASFYSLMKVGNDFLACNEELSILKFPSLIEKGSNFLISNKERDSIYYNYTMRTKIFFENLKNKVKNKLISK